MDDRQQALLRLHLTPGLGRTALFKLQRAFGCFEQAAAASAAALTDTGLPRSVIQAWQTQDQDHFQRTLEKLNRLQVRLISYWDADYPQLLKQIHDPPALLYVRGRLPRQDNFAIVGSRRATAAGVQFTQQLAARLTEHDICIVSGLARGIDTAAHRGALVGGGRTIAVLGCGIDRIYPPENARLFEQLCRDNAILSEYPPGTPPLAGHFPGRNRLISGLCRGVLIVEATENSGSLITGDFALEQGRDLFAVPGNVRHPNSCGTNRLLKQGAQLVTEVEDVLEALWPGTPSRKAQQSLERFTCKLQEPALKVFRQLGPEPCHIDEICRKCGLTPMDVSAILLDLELQGSVKPLPGGNYIRVMI